MDHAILIRKRHEAHSRILEVLKTHATGDAAERVEATELVFRSGGALDGVLEGYVIAEEVRALAEIVDKLATQQATPTKAKAKV